MNVVGRLNDVIDAIDDDLFHLFYADVFERRRRRDSTSQKVAQLRLLLL
jgi:hypothetical protein